MNGKHLKIIIPSFRFTGLIENLEPYLSVLPSATSTTLYTLLQYTADVACHQTRVTGLFRPQHRVLPALAFAPAGKGLGLEKGNLSRIRS
jgi:hypothetical protein